MKLSRRHLAAAGALMIGVTSVIKSALAEGPDEATLKKALDELRTAQVKQDKAKLEALTAAQLSYSHSDARLEDKAQYINGVMTRKAVVKSLEWPEMRSRSSGTMPSCGIFGCRKANSTARSPTPRSVSCSVAETGWHLEAAGPRIMAPADTGIVRAAGHPQLSADKPMH